MKSFKISGTGMFLPKVKIDSEELESRHNIPNGWSERYSGVKTRYHVGEMSGGELGAKAVEKALEKANLKVKDIDLLICTSATFDYPLPNQAIVIKAALSGSEKYNFPAFLVNSTCTGFITGLEVASNYLDGNKYKNIVVVSSEVASKGINPNSWETTTLFGDAAVAAIISYDESGNSGLIKAQANTYSEGVYDTIIKGGGNAFHAKEYDYDPEMHSFHMAGKKLLRMAKTHLPTFMTEFFSNLDLKMKDVDYILPHQASKFGLIMFMKLFNLKDNQVFGNLAEYGNCISASVPLLLHNGLTSGKIKKGDTCFLCGTSAGFSIGGALIRI